eukprot:2794232-Rhodomonas_salina.1
MQVGVVGTQAIVNVTTIGDFIDVAENLGPLTTAYWRSGNLYFFAVFGSNDGGANYPDVIGYTSKVVVGLSDAPRNVKA